MKKKLSVRNENCILNLLLQKDFIHTFILSFCWNALGKTFQRLTFTVFHGDISAVLVKNLSIDSTYPKRFLNTCQFQRSQKIFLDEVLKAVIFSKNFSQKVFNLRYLKTWDNVEFSHRFFFRGLLKIKLVR